MDTSGTDKPPSQSNNNFIETKHTQTIRRQIAEELFGCV